MYKEYDTFILTKRISGENIPLGTPGVILIIHSSDPPEYEVEFPDETGRNLGSKPTFTLTEEYMKTLTK